MDCPAAMVWMHGLPLREGPNALAAMAAQPFPPVGFSALMQRLRPLEGIVNISNAPDGMPIANGGIPIGVSMAQRPPCTLPKRSDTRIEPV